MDTEDLLARESIRDLVARYNLYGDTGSLAEMAHLFTTDGVLEYREGESRGEYIGRDQILGFMTGYAERLKASGDRPARVFHSVGTHVIDILDRDHARGSAYVQMLGADGLVEWGHYRDEYERVQGGWRLSRRRATTAGRA